MLKLLGITHQLKKGVLVKMDVKNLVSQMTLEEKAGLCSGKDFWLTKSVERLGVPSVMVSDGPHGLRKQSGDADHLGINDSIEAVCFPAGCATAASFDRDLIEQLGAAVGDECQAENVSVVLGPAVNIKRSPLCGRNFEYFSEDPYLASEMATHHILGVQSKNVGTSIKHFLANNQEHRRMSSSSEVDERTLREIYMAAFEGPVKNAKPWTVMCSYNRVNGVYASEDPLYLTDVLRGEWGFDGYVVSDWGAVNDRPLGLAAGLDLEMPASGGINDAKIVAAVNAGTLDEKLVDQAVERILNINYRFLENQKEDTVWDKEAHHKLAREIAAECMVLLKNDEKILPLSKEDKVAFIGKFATAPRFQGGGSSHINCFRKTSALDAAQELGLSVTYAQGYDVKADVVDEALMEEAVAAAKAANVAVLFVGLPDLFESEGYDRTHMNMPNCQNELIERVTGVQPNTIIVLHNGSPVEMPWVDDVKAILEVYLGGQAVGGATVDVLFGDKNPCGRLPETFPIQLEDNPSYLSYYGEGDIVRYTEGVFVGYRYYDKKNMEVLFPFGHGLSYTDFTYSNLKVSSKSISDTESLTVTVDVTNAGNRVGKEVVQLYVSDRESTVIRPIKELKGFEKVSLAPGETKSVSFTLDKRAFAYWNTAIHDWHVETGEFEILVAKSADQIELQEMVTVTSTVLLPVHFTLNSTFGDILADSRGQEVFAPLLEGLKQTFGASGETSQAASEAIPPEMMEAMLKYMPLRGMLSFSSDKLNEETMLQMLASINEK